MYVSYSSDEENLNFESSDDLDSEVGSFTGYGNEPEYTEQEISKYLKKKNNFSVWKFKENNLLT